MIRTILVPTSGTSTDDSVFAIAVALARPLGAHLHCLHLRFTVYEAAARAPHVAFCRGAALSHALEYLGDQDVALSAKAKKLFDEFCHANAIPVRSAPSAIEEISASWAEETDHVEEQLLAHARYSDLTVVGRRHNVDLMPGNMIELLLLESGRPVVIAGDQAAERQSGTIVVGWKQTSEAAHALTGAIPLLQRARRVVLVNIAEGNASPGIPDALIRQLAWQGIVAEPHALSDRTTPAAVQLPRLAAQLHADLLVAGAFGHSPLRESVFGGVTRALLEHAELPVFMLH
jgi:nucleotide-binding universal stress UspA family protein